MTLAALAARVHLAEAEAAVIAAEAELGLNVPYAYRRLTDAELRAGVRFGTIAERTERLAVAIAAATEPLRDLIVAYLPDYPDPDATVAVLTDWLAPFTPLPIPSLDRVALECRDAVLALLHQAWVESCRDVQREARSQGVDVPDDLAPMPRVEEEWAATGARAVVTARVRRTIEMGIRAAQTPPPPPKQMAALAQPVSIKQHLAHLMLTDAANPVVTAGKRALYAVNSAARLVQVAADGYPPVRRIYASEVMDEKTCGPCRDIDTTAFFTMTEALEQYRRHGGYLGCLGGDNCRGALIFTLVQEQGVAVDDVDWKISPPPPMIPPWVPTPPGTPPAAPPTAQPAPEPPVPAPPAPQATPPPPPQPPPPPPAPTPPGARPEWAFGQAQRQPVTGERARAGTGTKPPNTVTGRTTADFNERAIRGWVEAGDTSAEWQAAEVAWDQQTVLPHKSFYKFTRSNNQDDLGPGAQDALRGAAHFDAYVARGMHARSDNPNSLEPIMRLGVGDVIGPDGNGRSWSTSAQVAVQSFAWEYQTAVQSVVLHAPRGLRGVALIGNSRFPGEREVLSSVKVRILEIWDDPDTKTRHILVEDAGWG